MSAPRLAELGRGQKPVNDSLTDIRSFVVQKSIDLVASRRQTDQLKINSSQQGARISIRRRSQIGCFQLSLNEVVDRRPGPIFSFDLRWRRIAQRTKSPVLSTCDGVRRVGLIAS